MDAPQLGGVHQLLWRKVRCKYYQLVEQQRKLFSRVVRQIVDFSFQGEDPAVEQLVRAHALAAEVVDDEDAADRLHLQRRLVVFRMRIKIEIEHLEGQFTA